MDLARAPRRAPLTARKKGSGYENGVCPDVVFTGGDGGGECEKNIELRAHNLQAFYSGSENAKYTNTSRRNQVSMALFLFANIH